MEKHIEGSIEVLIEYKKGRLCLDKTVSQFSILTGIPNEIARKYIRALKRDNVLILQPAVRK